MKIKGVIKQLARILNLDIRKLSRSFSYQLSNFIISTNIDLIIDVGANRGQFGQECRQFGYSGQILSYEPLKSAYSLLQNRSKSDSKWECYNLALGDENTSELINISRNHASSSILDMTFDHVRNAPNSVYVAKEEIIIKRLDDVWDNHVLNVSPKNILLKIDTQGYEDQVMKGAVKSIEYIDSVILEMSFEELYDGQVLFDQHVKDMNELGFILYNIDPGLVDHHSGRLLQIDALFVRA